MKIVFATGNKGKLKEAAEIFKSVEIISIFEFTNTFEPEENGNSFLQNAAIKAEAALEIVKNFPVLSDDSGLVVPALNGEPGIYSSRFAGINATDAQNRKTLLEKMKNIDNRSAYFTCTAFLLFPDYRVLAADGRCYGKIGFFEKGENGFGYDSLFIPDSFGITLAEMSNNEKNKISHRGLAFRKMEKMLSCFQNCSE